MKVPQIFQYLDYRVYLGEWIQWKKGMDPDFSLRTFAKHPDLKLSSSSFLSAVLKGRKNLSQGLRLRFARAMDLQAGELEYFELLVQFNQGKSADEKNHYFAHLSKYHSSRARVLDGPRQRFHDRWFYRVVWNWLALHQGQGNPALLAKSIQPPLKAAEVEEALRVLLELRLIKRLANGYAVTDRHLASARPFAGPEAARHHRELLRLAEDNLDAVPSAARQYNALTFSISERGFGRIKERMDAFRSELRELVEADEGGDRVMALAMQLFPCTVAGPPGKGRGGASADTANPEPGDAG
jgi:uncharacterized protein (TIGR02147 family)